MYVIDILYYIYMILYTYIGLYTKLHNFGFSLVPATYVPTHVMVQ